MLKILLVRAISQIFTNKHAPNFSVMFSAAGQHNVAPNADRSATDWNSPLKHDNNFHLIIICVYIKSARRLNK